MVNRSLVFGRLILFSECSLCHLRGCCRTVSSGVPVHRVHWNRRSSALLLDDLRMEEFRERFPAYVEHQALERFECFLFVYNDRVFLRVCRQIAALLDFIQRAEMLFPQLVDCCEHSGALQPSAYIRAQDALLQLICTHRGVKEFLSQIARLFR